MNIVYTLYANLVMKESGKVFMWPRSILKQKTCPKGKTIVNTTVSLLSINCTHNEVRSHVYGNLVETRFAQDFMKPTPWLWGNIDVSKV